jgi:hypothetical protein
MPKEQEAEARAVASGKITAKQMKMQLFFFQFYLL